MNILKSIDDCVFGDAESKEILNYILTGALPFPSESIGKTGIILYGLPGTGKTTLARSICEWIEFANSGKEAFYPARFFGVESKRSAKICDQINETIRVVNFNESNVHYFILDEADQLSSVAMNNLKSLMGTNSNVVIVMTTNYLKKIPKDVQSRCYCVNMNPGPVDLYQERLKDIAKTDFDVELSDSSINNCVNKGEGGWRNMVTEVAIACAKQKKAA